MVLMDFSCGVKESKVSRNRAYIISDKINIHLLYIVKDNNNMNFLLRE